MKISIFWALLILISSAFATAAQTADFDVLTPSDEVQDIQGLAVLAEEQPLEVITPTAETQPDQTEAPAPEDKISHEQSYYIISYSTADIAASQKVLQNQLDIVYYIPDHQYLVKASEKELQRLQDKDIILEYTLVRDNPFRYLLGSDPQETLYYVYAFQTADVAKIARQLSDLGYDVLDVNTYVIVVDMSQVQDVERALREIVSIEGVEAAEQRPHYEVLNDVTNVVVGTTDIRQRFGLYGSGQIIAIADTGLDTGVLSTLHPDIRGRVISLTENVWDPGGICQGTSNPNDPQGHGTAVTGAAVGNGLQSGSTPTQHTYPVGSYAGAAPEARLIFQAVGCNQGGIFAQLPLQLYPPAYNLGARVHSNSYASGVQDGGYYFIDRDSDQYVNTRKNFILTMAAGNNGVGTMKTSNNAKNVVTVGGFIRDQSTTQIYARGPTKDGRYKPDILSAAGTTGGAGITTTHSSVQTLPGCSQLTSNPAYCGLSGTSIATPNVAGAAALVREYLTTQRSVNNPSASLVKAILLNGGDHMSNGIPNPNYGWGRMNLSHSFVDDMNNNFAFWDVTQGLATNGVREYTILVNENKPLRITLDWTDREACPEPTCSGTAAKLINDLDLVVTDTNGQVYYGNDISQPYNDQADRRNNVERVEVLTPIPGYYTIQIRGYNIPVGTQDFALVASYENYNSLLGCVQRNYPYPANIVC